MKIFPHFSHLKLIALNMSAFFAFKEWIYLSIRLCSFFFLKD